LQKAEILELEIKDNKPMPKNVRNKKAKLIERYGQKEGPCGNKGRNQN
jgi:hypothetical protein